MKSLALFAALFAALLVLTPSAARAYRGAPVSVDSALTTSAGVADRWERDRRYERGRRWDRDRRWRGRDRWRWRTRCHTQWRGGHRERVCRRIRYRR